MSKSNGFTLMEVLTASSIIFMLVTTFIPISSLIQQERTAFSDQRIISSYLHDELQSVLWENSNTPAAYNKIINNKTAKFHFHVENGLVKGCVQWENVKKRAEQICLYGYKTQESARVYNGVYANNNDTTFNNAATSDSRNKARFLFLKL